MINYLSPKRTLLLESGTREDAIRELVEAVCRDLPGVDPKETLNAVEAREKEIATGIAPGIALPHARIPGFGRFAVALGYSHAGISWNAPDEPPVHLVIMLLGDARRANEHIRILGALACMLYGDDVLEHLKEAATSPETLFTAFADLHCAAGAGIESEERRANGALFAHACALCDDLDAAAVLIIAEENVDLGFARERHGQVRTLLAAGGLTEESDISTEGFDSVFEAPISGLAPEHRLELSIFTAISEGVVEEGNTLVCLFGGARSPLLDTIRVLDIEREYDVLLSLRHDLVGSDIDRPVLSTALTIAAELAREGREGKPIGALFVLGDAEKVMARSRQLVVNPFKGYPEEERNILDPSLHETIKEYSLLDGAIIVRGDGVVLAAGAYLDTQGLEVSLLSGLGARHSAAAAITAAAPGALSIAVSESTGAVRLFLRGRQAVCLKRDLR